MKLHQLFDPQDNKNIRTFIPNPDGTVTVWMFIDGGYADESVNCLDEVLSLNDAKKWNQMFLDQGWLTEEQEEAQRQERNAWDHQCEQEEQEEQERQAHYAYCDALLAEQERNRRY